MLVCLPDRYALRKRFPGCISFLRQLIRKTLPDLDDGAGVWLNIHIDKRSIKNRIKEMTEMATINIATLATELDTDPRTARKFMRSVTPRDEQPGKGARWEIEKRTVASLRKKFAKFTAELDAKRAQRESDATANDDAESIEVSTD